MFFLRRVNICFASKFLVHCFRGSAEEEISQSEMITEGGGGRSEAERKIHSC